MTAKQSGIRLNRLTIENYKKIDRLEIEFPRPLMAGDADIFLFGSENGGGKTSVLECCALLMLAGHTGKKFNLFGEKFNQVRETESPLDIANLLVKAGQTQATLGGVFKNNNKSCDVFLIIHRDGIAEVRFNGDVSIFKHPWPFSIGNAVNSLFAFSSEPLLIPPLLHFNSYRKIQESNPELGMMADDYPISRAGQLLSRLGGRSPSNPISSFKLEILRALMAQASLFEGLKQDEAQLVLSQLNHLIQRYCGGEIEQLKLLPDNKVDIRIKPTSGGESFSFDGLSSGQKEMIATLFLIWRNSQEQPCIVLIDEPELHLNAQWHGDFVRQLYKLAPQNQYILATHSEAMFRSVDERQRAILVPDDAGEMSL